MILGITGYAGAGKTTVANIFCEQAPFYKLSFANKLRDIAQQVYPHMSFFDNNAKEIVDLQTGCTPRQILQMLGTDVFRKIDSDTWVRLLKAQIEATWLEKPHVNIVIDDVRFPNELKIIDYLIYVDRPNVYPKKVMKRILGFKTYTVHESEQYVSGLKECANFVLLNDGAKEDIKDKIILKGFNTHGK